MTSIDLLMVQDLFSRLFVLGIHNKINLTAFTKNLERSIFVQKIESGNYDDYFNRSIEDIFFDIANKRIEKDNSFGIYNDAYWCGTSYFKIFEKSHKPFVYIFLKLPLQKLINLYSIYHEMDFSSLYEYFLKVSNEKTILRLLCEEKKCSLPKLSNLTTINLSSLSKYNASDELLYKASFQTIYRLANFFDVPYSLFVN